jgi:cell shape-determining protein MreC
MLSLRTAGIVGRIQMPIGTPRAKVKLIIDPTNPAAGGLIERPGWRWRRGSAALMRWEFIDRALKLEYVPGSAASLKKGDSRSSTSGIDGIYPKGFGR